MESQKDELAKQAHAAKADAERVQLHTAAGQDASAAPESTEGSGDTPSTNTGAEGSTKASAPKEAPKGKESQTEVEPRTIEEILAETSTA